MKSYSQINPFIRNPLIQEQISLDELLVAVGKFTKQAYASTAISQAEYVHYVFKTIDLNNREHVFPQVESIERIEPFLGYYALKQLGSAEQMFFYLCVSHHQIVINLRTQRAAIRLHGSNFSYQNFLDWPPQSEWPAGVTMRLSLDRLELHKLGLEL